MAAVVSIINIGVPLQLKCIIETNLPYKSTLALCTQVTRWSTLVLCGIHVSRHLKEELAWAADKWLSNIMLFETVIPLKN